MGNYISTDNADLGGNLYTSAPLRRGFDGVRTAAMLGAIALIALPAYKEYSRRRRLKNPVASTEPAIDKQLKDTYPASDPPASRYFDIPENRR